MTSPTTALPGVAGAPARPRDVLASLRAPKRDSTPAWIGTTDAYRLPLIEADRAVPYAECRECFKGMDEADLALAIVRSRTYQHLVPSALRGFDERTCGERGVRERYYSAEELELLRIYTRLQGFRKYDEARLFLTSDLGTPHRRKLGFDHPRDAAKSRQRCTFDGLPNDKTMKRHLDRFAPGERARLFD
jgi:hypothetical protein